MYRTITTTMSPELKSHFLHLFRMALSDDRFSVSELEMLYHLAEEKGIQKEELDKLFLNPVMPTVISVQNLETRIEYLYDLTRMIWADGQITNEEKELLKKYCKKFEFLEENIDDLTGYLIRCVQNGIRKEEIINQLKA